MHQQARRDRAVRRVLFHQRARRQDGGLVQFLDRHAVIQVLDGLGQDRLRIHVLLEADTGGADQAAHLVHVERTALSVLGHVQLRRRRGRSGGLLLRALFHALGAVQHIGARNVMLARTHQRQLDLVLHVLDMEGAAGRLAAHQRRHHVRRQLFHHFAHARRCRALPAIDRKECLGHGDRDLRRLETDDRTVAADDFVVAEIDRHGAGRWNGLGKGRQRAQFAGRLHGNFVGR